MELQRLTAHLAERLTGLQDGEGPGARSPQRTRTHPAPSRKARPCQADSPSASTSLAERSLRRSQTTDYPIRLTLSRVCCNAWFGMLGFMRLRSLENGRLRYAQFASSRARYRMPGLSRLGNCALLGQFLVEHVARDTLDLALRWQGSGRDVPSHTR